ncbi:MAG: response regulator [Pseudobdellovibrionaceae bacterium]|nr:response regulator [Pseudobdellovibrionaceae bacterium]
MLPGVTQKDSDLIPRIMRQLWVFLAYVAAARLAILLALPPGYASPIWPAAGIAIAATIVWGPSLTLAVFLGSIATNLRPDELIQHPMHQILVQLCLALGSSLQAYLGSLIYHALNRRLPNQAHPQRLAWEVFLLGPITCLIAATLGVSALTAFHVIDFSSFPTNWIWWWLGDAFGAGMLAPLLIRMHQGLYTNPGRFKLPPFLLAPAALSLVITTALTIHLTQTDHRNRGILKHEVNDFHLDIQEKIEHALQHLQMLAELSQIVDPLVVIDNAKTWEKPWPRIMWIPQTQFANQNEIPGPLLQKAWDESRAPRSFRLQLASDQKAVLVMTRSLNAQTHATHPGLLVAVLTWSELIQPALPILNHAVFHIQIQNSSDRSTPEALYQSWFGRDAAGYAHPRAPLYGSFQKPLKIADQIFNLQVDFPAEAFNSGRNGDPIFMTLLAIILAFTFNVFFLSLQNKPAAESVETKAQYDELLHHYETLRDADRDKANLLANISHQIKSPLHGILGLLDMLHASALDTKQRSGMETIISNCQSMRMMLDDVHTYGAMEANLLTLVTEEFLIEKFLCAVISVYELAAEERQNQFHYQIDLPTTLQIQGDRGQLHRILSHLLGDAISRTHRGRINVSASHQADGTLIISIQTRQGSQEEVHDNDREFGNIKNYQPMEIFNLKICDRLVQAMGGRLVLERPDPLTNKITLRLPWPVVALQASGPQAVEPHTYQNVLVVDDNTINLTVASSLLVKLGYSVDTALDGPESLEKIKNKRYDVIFMDCQMPRMDGFETTQRIRTAYRPDRGPLILALTANALDGVQGQAIHAGMDGVLTKPISLDALIKTVGYAKAPAPQPALPLAPLMDLKAFSQGLAHDDELIQTAILRYFEEIDGLMNRLRSEVERGDAGAAAKIAHTLKGLTLLFAAPTLVEAHQALEAAGKAGHVHELPALLQPIEGLTDRLKVELKKLVNDNSISRKDVA